MLSPHPCLRHPKPAIKAMTSTARAPDPGNPTTSDPKRASRAPPTNTSSLRRVLGLGEGGRKTAKTPHNKPNTTPTKASNGPCKRTLARSALGLKVIPRMMVKAEMARTSSTEAAAITRVGIPLATPHPFSCKARRQGTTTAGLTAAKTKPSMKPQIQGSCIRK